MKRQLRIAIPGQEKNVLNYMAAMRGLGAEPVVVDQVCDAEGFDGIIMPGGVDVDPARYDTPNLECGGIDPELDELQFTMLDRFIKLGKPVFGICRGQQVINVYFGGTLIQDIKSAIRHPRYPGAKTDEIHESDAVEGSFLAQLYGTHFVTNSAHHQSILKPGEGLHIVQYAPDGVVEAAYHETLPVWSVQWHPERMCFAHRREDTVDGSLVLQFFLDRCAEYADTILKSV